MIELHENNAGGLLVGNDEVGYWAANGGSFVDDAEAIRGGNTEAWTAEHFDALPDGYDLVAQCDAAGVTLLTNEASGETLAGYWAQRYAS